MRKEVLFAIIVGALVGLVIAFGVWRANKAFMPQRGQAGQQAVTTGALGGPGEQQVQNSQLIVTSPENNSIVSSNKIVVEGTAPAESTIVITTNVAEAITQASGGAFRQEIEVDGGANEVKVASYDQEANKSEVVLTIVYSTEFTQE